MESDENQNEENKSLSLEAKVDKSIPDFLSIPKELCINN